MSIDLLDAVPWLRRYAGATFVIKAGGDLVDRPEWRDGIARDVAALHRLGVKVVLVHGGGPQLDRAASERGIAERKVAGRRVTSPELIVAAAEVWRGRVALEVVQALARQGEAGVSVSGAEGGLIRAKVRAPRRVTDDDGREIEVDYGRVGDVERVDPAVLKALLAAGVVPVITPLAYSRDGSVLNVNADTVAASVAVAIGASKLVLLTRAPGILSDPDDPTSVLHVTDPKALDRLEGLGVLTGGMRPKIAAIQSALSGGVPRAHVVDGRRAGALLEEVFTNAGSGTLVLP